MEVTLRKPRQVDLVEEINNKVDSVLKTPAAEIRKVVSGRRTKVGEILKGVDVLRIRGDPRGVGAEIILADSVAATVAKANAAAIIRAVEATPEVASATGAIVLRDRAINLMVTNPAIRHENSFCSMRHGSLARGVWRQPAGI